MIKWLGEKWTNCKEMNLVVFWPVFSALVIIRIWLITGVPQILLYAPHDDLYFAKMAHHILHGQWFGPYSQMTLIKGPFYAFFLIYSFLTGLPLLLNETVFYIIACIVLFFAISPLIKNKWWRLLLFTLILFIPASLATNWFLRVYREFVYFSLTLFVVAFSTGLFLRINRKISSIIFWAVGLGLSMGAFMLTREEGIWIYPILLFLLGSCIIKILFSKMDHKGLRSFIVFSSIIIWYIPIFVVSYLNYSYYGYWGYSENLDKDFNRVINSIGRIKTSVWYPYSPVSKEALEKAYRVSPLLSELQPKIAASWDGWIVHSDLAITNKPNWYLEKYFIKSAKEMGYHFIFLFRDVLASKGYYSSGRYPREYMRELADQIETACNNGTVDCYASNNIPFVGSMRAEYVPIIFRFFIEDIYRLLIFETGSTRIASLDIKNWGPYNNEFVYFEEFVYNPISPQYYGEDQSNDHLVGGKTDVRVKILLYKEKIMLGIESFYKAITLPVYGIACFGWLGLIIFKLIKRQKMFFSQALYIFVFLLGLLCSRVLTLSIVSAKDAQYYIIYGASIYVFIYILLFFVVFYFVDYIPKSIFLDRKKN